MRLLYTVVLCLVVPLIVARLMSRGFRERAYRDRISERFGLGTHIGSRRGCLWVHAASVGEVQAATPIVRALESRYPGETILVTTTTPTGAQRAVETFGDSVVHRYLPFDLPWTMARYLDRVKPRVAIIMETEIWPNLMALCRAREVPVVLANARLSERSASRYRMFRRLYTPVFRGVAAVAAQSDKDAIRLASIGAPQECIDVTGNTKFDVPIPTGLRENAAALRRTWGATRRVWIAASTHQGEESQILAAFEQVHNRLPESLLILVPRHPERFPEAEALARRCGLISVLRSQRTTDCTKAQVYIGDTMGELLLLYAAADVAFVGGSLVEIGGHNVLEPAALGVPVFFGPHHFNFAEISRQLVEAGGAEIIIDTAHLARSVIRHLEDEDLRSNAGEKGRAFVKSGRGAWERVIAMITPHVEGHVTD
ncbi:MAG: lipid IV(A) 3-deoxy-D-manno-octulosonic acid transferase [Thiotrichales bacterium]|nr:lipid IV(A) 3-deoxy-D-manno-octulosonic acid transferase [Thiotrichales bacterium]